MFPNDVTATHDFESLDKAMGGFDALREAMGHAYRREPQRERKDSRVMALTGDALCSLRAPSLVVCALNRRSTQSFARNSQARTLVLAHASRDFDDVRRFVGD